MSPSAAACLGLMSGCSPRYFRSCSHEGSKVSGPAIRSCDAPILNCGAHSEQSSAGARLVLRLKGERPGY
jgi:hypothetical protein